jgi:poly(beta-D-mannuronate) lyase
MRSLFLFLAVINLCQVASAACPTPPPAQRDIIADMYYDDPPVYSHIDPVKHAAYEAAVKPLEDYLGAVARMASSNAREDKDCAVHWLVAWAEGDAMLGKIEKEQAHYERKWILAGLALSYAKVRATATIDQAAAIDVWLKAVAFRVRQHSNEYRGERNNHYYWEGLAVAATGVVAGDADDVQWGRKVFADAEADIADDGTLPREMTRGARALHYHLFAAAPLAMLESMLDIHSPKFSKLAEFASRTKPDEVAKRAGVAQVGVLDDDYDWVGIYLRHNPPKIHGKIHNEIRIGHVYARAPYVIRLGGDLSKPNPLEHVAGK